MKYNYTLAYRDKDVVWPVYELGTNLEIAVFWFEPEAERYVEFLENGGAFNGFTPAFVTKKVVIKKDINEEFSSIFA